MGDIEPGVSRQNEFWAQTSYPIDLLVNSTLNAVMPLLSMSAGAYLGKKPELLDFALYTVIPWSLPGSIIGVCVWIFVGRRFSGFLNSLGFLRRLMFNLAVTGYAALMGYVLAYLLEPDKIGSITTSVAISSLICGIVWMLRLHGYHLRKARQVIM